ncbi:hypothetical protein [Ferruginibacter sp.]
MNNVEIGMYCFWAGLIMTAVVTIFSTLYHKYKKIHSFTLVLSENKVILQKNRFTAIMSSTNYFFILTCFTFFIGTNKYDPALQLTGIYFICLVLAALNYWTRIKFRVQFDLVNRTVLKKAAQYSFEGCTLEASNRNYWITDDITSYGLYLVDSQKKYRLIYGYSVYTDIEKLRQELAHLLNMA